MERPKLPPAMTAAQKPRPIVAAGVYLAAAIALTWPLAISLTTRLGALQGPGDPYLNLWIVGWGLRAWTTNPMSVLSGRVFDANIFFPAEGTLAYSDHLLLHALVLAPVYALTHNVVLCYNLLVIVSIALSGAAMHALARAVTGSTPAAFAAGLAWACWPYHTAQLLHVQLELLVFMPLALLCLHRVMARRRWRDAIALAICTALQAIASVYYGVMTAVVLGVASITLAIATGQWRSRRLWIQIAAATALSALLAAPALIPYARSQQAEGFGRTLVEAANHSASLESYAQVPPANLAYGRTGLLLPRPPTPGQRDRQGVEDQLFPGVVISLLAILGFVTSIRRDARPLAATAAALAIAGFILSLGPEGFRTIYAALHDNLFGFQAIRVPARFAVVAMLGVVLLGALGMRAVLAWLQRARPSLVTLAPFVLIALIGAEYVNAPLPLAAAPPLTTPVGQWLAHEPTPGAVVHLPLGSDFENTPFMVQSLEHGRPIVNGYSGQRPAFFSALVDNLAAFPSADALVALYDLDVRFVVSPAPVAEAGTGRSPLVERARLADGVIYELQWTPDAVAALDEDVGPPPPSPGTIPFEVGESAAYEVRWDGGAMNLPAGTAVLRVVDGGGDRPWQFEATAETAAWIAPFFQAQDRFVTTADRELQPLEHVREIREGRRRLDRTYIFDREAQHVRIGETRTAAMAADALTLPLAAPGTRDALTALYYIRTLTLPPAGALSVPVNEGGSTLVMQIAGAQPDTIDIDGTPTPAIRIELQLMRRIERRQPFAMTVWLSADERKIPLRAIVDAGFGKVRLELKRYAR